MIGTGSRLPKLGVIVSIAAMALLVSAADSENVETRTFTGTGSRDQASDVEFFLVGGTYGHQLETSADCFATAGVFPSERQPRVTLREVLPADLAAGTPESSLRRAGPSGAFDITTSGWATLQIGTGSSCSWTYSIRGAFLAPGDEPEPPGHSGMLQWWELVLILIGIAIAVALSSRRSPSVRREQMEEEKVRTLPTAPGENR